jgi:hypothetical protein
MKYAKWAAGCGDPDELLEVVGTYEDGRLALVHLNGAWRHYPISVSPICLVEVDPRDVPQPPERTGQETPDC